MLKTSWNLRKDWYPFKIPYSYTRNGVEWLFGLSTNQFELARCRFMMKISMDDSMPYHCSSMVGFIGCYLVTNNHLHWWLPSNGMSANLIGTTPCPQSFGLSLLEYSWKCQWCLLWMRCLWWWCPHLTVLKFDQLNRTLSIGLVLVTIIQWFESGGLSYSLPIDHPVIKRNGSWCI